MKVIMFTLASNTSYTTSGPLPDMYLLYYSHNDASWAFLLCNLSSRSLIVAFQGTFIKALHNIQMSLCSMLFAIRATPVL